MHTGSADGTRHSPARPRLLIVEDDNEMRALLAEFLGEEGYEADQAADGAEALRRLQSQPFEAIILDRNMPGTDALDLLPGLHTLCPQTPIILISAFGDAAALSDALGQGACEYVFKPFRMEELLQVLQRALSAGVPSPAPPLAPGAMG